MIKLLLKVWREGRTSGMGMEEEERVRGREKKRKEREEREDGGKR